MTIAVELPTTHNVTAEEMAASLQGLVAGSVAAEVKQTWSLTLSNSSTSNMTALVAEVLAVCQAASPSCQVSLVSTARRGLASGTGWQTVGAVRRGLRSNVQVQLERSVPSNAPVTEGVPLPATVLVSAASLETLEATMTITQSGGAAEAQALSERLSARAWQAKSRSPLGWMPRS